MANLDEIQQLLNTNQEYRAHFLQDPVAALAQQGLHLSMEMQGQLRQVVREAVAGSAGKPGAAMGSSAVLYKPNAGVYKPLAGGAPLLTKPLSGLNTKLSINIGLKTI